MNRSFSRRFPVILLVLGAPFTLLSQVPAHAQLAEPSIAAATAPHVGLQVGHWKITQLPASLARLRGDTGGSGGGRTEVSLNMDIATRAAQILRSQGVQVDILPATVPTGYRADAFVAIHTDGNNSASARGYKLATRWRSNVAFRDETLVEMLDQEYGGATGLPHDFAVTRNMRGYYAFNTWFGDQSRISDYTPAAIIEMGYMTNSADRAVLFNRTGAVASGIAGGIMQFLNHGSAADAIQARTQAVAATSPTRWSVVVIHGGTPIKLTTASGAATLTVAGYSASFAYLDNIVRPKGPFNNLHGTELAKGSGYLRIGFPGVPFPVYISRDAVVVQQAP